MKVHLEWYEVSRAALVGVSRNVEAMRRGCAEKLKGSVDAWERHVKGALGECAFAKATNRYWSGSVNTFKAPDFEGNIQVRARSDNNHDLIVREDDHDEDLFVLVTGGPSEFTIHGWVQGLEAKRNEYRANPGGYGVAYFVPHSALRPIDPLVQKDC